MMQAYHSRKQLQPPCARDAATPLADPQLGKRSAPSSPHARPPPSLVVKRLRKLPVAPHSTEPSSCAPGCLRQENGHAGLCITEEGVAPPSIKAVWARAKKETPTIKATRPILFPMLTDAVQEME